jgi:hypothetical protein
VAALVRRGVRNYRIVLVAKIESATSARLFDLVNANFCPLRTAVWDRDKQRISFRY